MKTYVGEGEFTDDPFGMDGGIAVTRVARLRRLLGLIARNGFEHHVAMVRGHHADAVNEALVRYLDWPTYRHEAAPTAVFRVFPPISDLTDEQRLPPQSEPTARRPWR